MCVPFLLGVIISILNPLSASALAAAADTALWRVEWTRLEHNQNVVGTYEAQANRLISLEVRKPNQKSTRSFTVRPEIYAHLQQSVSGLAPPKFKAKDAAKECQTTLRVTHALGSQLYCEQDILKRSDIQTLLGDLKLLERR